MEKLLSDAERLDGKTLCAAMSEALDGSDDKDLHGILSSYMAEHIKSLIDLAKFAEVPGVDDVALSMFQRLSKRLQGLKSDNEEKRLSLIEHKNASDDQNCRINNLTKSIALLNRHDECRNSNCGIKFQAWLEDQGNGVHVLRCVRCRCRHT